MNEELQETEEKLDDIDSEFLAGKEIIEFFEKLARKDEVSYDTHVERLNRLRFLYVKLVEWREMKKSLQEASVSKEEEVVIAEEAEDFDPKV